MRAIRARRDVHARRIAMAAKAGLIFALKNKRIAMAAKAGIIRVQKVVAHTCSTCANAAPAVNM